LWNYHDVDGPGEAVSATAQIGGVPAGVHKVLSQHFRIDDTHSNAYTVWKAMGSPQSPTAEQFARLKAGAGLLLGSPAWLDVVDGKVAIATAMPRESVSLLRLTW
jgi:xylan 1,4-beta-xylosidase